MKKFVIICIAVCLLFAAYESRIELPPVDNTTPAEELITHTYSDADLALIEENYDNILDLARDYKIECIRDPREFFENYLPYIVLMSDTGKRVFIYYDDPVYNESNYHYDDNDIYFCLFTDKFMGYDEMNSLLQDMANNGTTWEEVKKLYPYDTGLSSTAKGNTQCVAVKEGVFVTFVYNVSAKISRIDYYSDEEIFCTDDIVRDHDLIWTIKPLLTIDKNW